MVGSNWHNFISITLWLEKQVRSTDSSPPIIWLELILSHDLTVVELFFLH